MAIEIVHYIYLAFGCMDCVTPDRRITHWHVVNYDFFYWLVGRPALNLTALGASYLVIYLNNALFFSPNLEQIHFLRKLLIENQWQLFFLRSKDTNGHDICEQLRKCFIWTANLFLSIILTLRKKLKRNLS